MYEINENGCFNCVSHRIDESGYAEIRYKEGGKRKQTGVHRYIYIECFGEIPEGMVVMHKCDNPQCINPEHLSVGTHADNMRDMAEKGRSLRGKTRKNFTLEERNFITSRTDLSHVEVANILGCNYKHIRQVRNKPDYWKSDGSGRFGSKIDTENVEIKGITKTLSQWSIETGIKYNVLHKRLTLGWTGEDLLKPVRKKKQ